MKHIKPIEKLQTRIHKGEEMCASSWKMHEKINEIINSLSPSTNEVDYKWEIKEIGMNNISPREEWEKEFDLEIQLLIGEFNRQRFSEESGTASASTMQTHTNILNARYEKLRTFVSSLLSQAMSKYVNKGYDVGYEDGKEDEKARIREEVNKMEDNDFQNKYPNVMCKKSEILRLLE